MAMNFKGALDTTVDKIERPPTPPIGSYIFQITKVPEMQEDIKGKDTTFDAVNFQCVAVEATDEIDQDELREFGALKNIQIRKSFMFDKEDDNAFNKNLFQLRRFLEEHLKVPFEGVSLKQALASAVNQRFIGVVRLRPDKNDPEIQYAEIGRTAPVE